MEIPKKISVRQQEIADDFLKEVDKNLSELVSGKTEKMLEIEDIAAALHVQPRHLSNTVKWVTGSSPCALFEEKILITAKRMLAENTMNIASIAMQLTYDPSNFTKFFKRYTGKTPKQFREDVFWKKTEHITI
ncbi:AraC family transcriptional regulator [Olivibacter sp. XZL3]|uniref:helix-turn-helix domain-containing protein n=1 Tax=Olivibacter sp. XZL3 TaxID=1735116 RepID=UPI0010667033|nr:helix-turn-helix domain-containing protein [Olivibacter sp. XZL3]